MPRSSTPAQPPSDPTVLTWGLGVELESHYFVTDREHGERRELARVVGLFRRPELLRLLKDPRENPVLAERFGFTAEEAELFLSPAVDPKLERSAKRCAGLLPPRAKMLELVTVGHVGRTVHDVCAEMTRSAALATSAVAKMVRDPEIRAQLRLPKASSAETVGAYPYGAAIFVDPASTRILKDYTGSVQFTITLPHVPAATTKDAFVAMHAKFGEHLQWLEPLMVASLFTPDPSCVVEPRYVHSAFRTVRYGWGNFGGTDMRRLGRGVGRRANVRPFWRKRLRVRNAVDLATDECSRARESQPSSRMDARSGMYGNVSSDMRTFGLEGGRRVSGAPMATPNGFEFRIFDRVEPRHIQDALTMVAFVAENSRRCADSDAPVHRDPVWIDQLHDVISRGWRAKVSRAYLDKVQAVLELPHVVLRYDELAHATAQRVWTALQDKCRGGGWLPHLLGDERAAAANFALPDVNREAYMHFYKCAYNSANRRSIVRALNGFDVGATFTAERAIARITASTKQQLVHLRALALYVLDGERPDLVRSVGKGRYMLIKRLPLPVKDVTVRCKDDASTCEKL
jgi:hypothetical protein